MTNERTWTDQPACLDGTHIVATISLPNATAEVRKASAPLGAPGWTWYVTIGNLFGSQTLKCCDAETALMCIAAAGRNRKRPVELPAGATLVAS